MLNAAQGIKKPLSEKIDIQIPHTEISLFTSIIAITLSSFFYGDRVGLVNPMTSDVVKTLGLSLFLLNLPPIISAFLKNKSPHEQLSWYKSQAFITIVVLSAIIFTGFMVQDNNYYCDAVLSMTGYLAFFLILSRYIYGTILQGIIMRNVLFIFAFFAFSLWVTGVVWGSGNFWQSHYYIYMNPLYIEAIYLGNAHLDTLFHSSITHMIQTYGIPSTGLDGLPYLPYHFGSHWIFAQISRLIRINPIYFYQLCYPVIFIPFYFCSLFLFVAELRNVWSGWGDSDQPLFRLPAFTIFVVAFIPFLPNKLLYSLGLGGNNNLISQSYLISLTLVFLFFCLIASFWKRFNDNKKISKIDVLFLFAIVPSFIAGIGLSKISVMFIMFVTGSYLFIRLGLFRHYQFLVSYFISTFVFLTVFSFTKTSSFVEVYSLTTYLHNLRNYLANPWNSLYVIVHYFWSLVFICLALSANRISNTNSLKGAFLKKATVMIEMVIVICIAGFLPGALMRHLGGNEFYFSDIQKWVSLSFLLALCDYDFKNIKLKPIRIILLLLFLPLIYAVYSNGKEPFLSYRSRTSTIRKQIIKASPQRLEILNILQNLNRLPLSQKRNFLLFIPQNNLAYWGLADRINCYSVPFIAPALSGIAMIDGLPPAQCGEPDDWILRHNGYDCYQLRTAEQTERDRTDSAVCSKALKKGFEYIMRIDQTEAGLQLASIQCK